MNHYFVCFCCLPFDKTFGSFSRPDNCVVLEWIVLEKSTSLSTPFSRIARTTSFHSHQHHHRHHDRRGRIAYIQYRTDRNSIILCSRFFICLSGRGQRDIEMHRPSQCFNSFLTIFLISFNIFINMMFLIVHCGGGGEIISSFPFHWFFFSFSFSLIFIYLFLFLLFNFYRFRRKIKNDWRRSPRSTSQRLKRSMKWSDQVKWVMQKDADAVCHT